MNTNDKPAYSPGLAGVIAGESAICWVDPDAGLLYRGYDVHELAGNASFEEIAWLLLHGELPDMEQMGIFARALSAERGLPAQVTDMLRLLPADTHPMDALRTGVSMLAPFDRDLNDHSHEANLRKAIRLIAKVSTLAADSWRILHGEDRCHVPDDLTHAGQFLFALNGVPPESWQVEILDTVLVLYADHEFNASTFSARVTASTLSDMYAAVTTAIGTLKGPLHGGANEEALAVLKAIGSPENVDPWVHERLARKEKIMGFGHRVYRTGDSRVPAMRELARQLGERTGETFWLPVCEKLEETMAREKNLCANVDLYAAVVLRLMGFPAALNPAIFALSRVAGWCAHVIEQHDHNHLIRPRSIYTGPPRRKLRV
ncbi:MAG TPA: citrate/2-methylcitrate synthase [Chthoniobacter sp.]|jgi:citrate synthase